MLASPERGGKRIDERTDQTMASEHDPPMNIQRLAVGPRDDSVLEQREITVQSYRSTVPFDRDRIEQGLERAWLSPTIRFGVFATLQIGAADSATVVLGLQDELSVRTYDYDRRRPLWYSWHNVIVDTVSIHYFRDEHGLLKFTATGGGRRITDDILYEFNATHLGIPKDSVSKEQFDLEKLRHLCFSRFSDRLYMLRFAGPSGDEYRSIDHALFQSRKYIDPAAERLSEIRADPNVTIESFDSDVDVSAPSLAGGLQIRFFLRGLSGSLRLRFPKIRYAKEPTTPEDHARVFYQLVETTVRTILDANYYTHVPRALDDLALTDQMFVDMVDLAPYREVMAAPEARVEFLGTANFSEDWNHWQPHLRALAELAEAEEIASDIGRIIRDLAVSAPQRLPALLCACRNDAKSARVCEIAATACCDVLQRIPADHRASVEAELVAWALEQPAEAWEVDVPAECIRVRTLTMRLDDLALDTIVAVLAKLLPALHTRLVAATGDLRPLLDQLEWCVQQIVDLPPAHHQLPASLRLIASKRIPHRPHLSDGVLREPVKTFAELDDALLEQFGLPVWPVLQVSENESGVVITNRGLGAASSLSVRAVGSLFDNDGDQHIRDLAPGEELAAERTDGRTGLTLRFLKYGAERVVMLKVDARRSKEPTRRIAPRQPTPISRKRREAQRAYRAQIDSDGHVIGTSPGILEVFEQIHHANRIDGLAHVLILGEPGVGKTHIAELIHKSSDRANKPFRAVNAGGSGGDLNIQRGEWVGFGKGHGLTGIDPKGRSGYLQHTQGGTLFVDEFATMSPELQVVFLSVLEQRDVERVGGESFPPDVRCVFATNADIDAEVAAGRLRRDLVDRLSITIRIPPLRERRGDILLLARHYTAGIDIDEQCLVGLLRHDWPGNIRGLEKTLSLAKVRAEADGDGRLTLDHVDLPDAVKVAARALSEEDCRRELWVLADSIARDEGYSLGAGLQKRAGEIMRVGESQASKMYRTFGLSEAAVAQSA
ncbi:MAG: sigma-54-dependent Fis family transcriptional regulator [Phycisphaeraceae bacterium]|nr:sigma-54-dependent Fis family transcriptional regulator [Phycisphaeraceae bacterium]